MKSGTMGNTAMRKRDHGAQAAVPVGFNVLRHENPRGFVPELSSGGR